MDTCLRHVPFEEFRLKINPVLREWAAVNLWARARALELYLNINDHLLNGISLELSVPETIQKAIDAAISAARIIFDQPGTALALVNERTVETTFLERLLGALGWQDSDFIQRRESIARAGQADYVVRYFDWPALVIEAKRPSKTLGRTEVRQALRYAGRLPEPASWVIVTNAIELRTYHRLASEYPVFRISFGKSGWQLSERDRKYLYLLSRHAFERGNVLQQVWHSAIQPFK